MGVEGPGLSDKGQISFDFPLLPISAQDLKRGLGWGGGPRGVCASAGFTVTYQVILQLASH